MMITQTSDVQGLAARHMAFAFRTAFADVRHPSVTLLPSGGVQMKTGEPHLFGNFAIGFSDDEVEGIANALVGTGMPACLIFVDGVSDRARSQFKPLGFEHEEPAPAMAVDIEALLQVPLHEGYRFERFFAGGDATGWARTFALGYGLPQGVADAFSPLTISVDSAEDASVQFFRVAQGDVTAGVSVLIVGDGVAGIYCVAVAPEHRQRGLGAFLTAEPLRAARGLGYRVAVLQASEMGYPVYRRLGFEDVGSVALVLRLPA